MYLRGIVFDHIVVAVMDSNNMAHARLVMQFNLFRVPKCIIVMAEAIANKRTFDLIVSDSSEEDHTIPFGASASHQVM